ncbi:hypothetical protein [Agromyces allii]|uniref:Lipoprotein n=1 Tax=Agromyces allii TaxID=393607 RepID=A0ABP5BHU4_9MICO|nr:hypothetical protein [Agromyces allii]
MSHFPTIRRALASAAILALATTLLAGCSAAAEPPTALSPVVSEAPAPTPTPTPSPTETTAAAIVLAPDALRVLAADDTVITSFDYYEDDAASVVVALDELMGESAATEEVHGSQETLPATRHTWGSLTLVEYRYVDGWDRSKLMPTRAPSFSVELTGSDSNGIELATADGTSVGRSWAELQADPAFLIAGECAHAYTESVEREITWYDGSLRMERIVVDLVPSGDAGSLAIVRAPVVETGCV